ncbi:malonate transporter subunit MadL [bacterium]|nr:malonate transporter subunit MadL [bacterium]MDB4506155.1 malonate transporter subunit MadL [bacterium]
MVIYGTALLAFCMLVGLVAGQLLGILLGVGKNVGGVGIAMLLLIVLSDWLRRRDRLPTPTQQGVLFWSSIYIPIVVAMAASQNVVKAASGGWLALVAGVTTVLACLALVPVLSRLGTGGEDNPESQSGAKE